MKPTHSALEKTLDELADGLDAGWDIPDVAPVSLAAHSTPLPLELDQLDAEWDVASPVRPSPARPNPTRALVPSAKVLAAPLSVSKKDRRDAERRRRAHEAQQKAAHKKQRKAERRAEALSASEQNRQAEARARAERAAREQASVSQKQAKASQTKPSGAPGGKLKRARPEPQPSARVAPKAALDQSKPKAATRVVRAERAWQKLILPLMIALLVAVTLGFALSRAR